MPVRLPPKRGPLGERVPAGVDVSRDRAAATDQPYWGRVAALAVPDRAAEVAALVSTDGTVAAAKLLLGSA